MNLFMIKHEDLFDYKSNCFENEKHQTRVSLLLELVNDAYLTANQTDYLWSSRQETSPHNHTRLFSVMRCALSCKSEKKLQLL